IAGLLYSFSHRRASSDSTKPFVEAPSFVVAAPFDFEPAEVEPLEPDATATTILAAEPLPIAPPAHVIPAPATVTAATEQDTSQALAPTIVAAAGKQVSAEPPSPEPAKPESKQPTPAPVEARKEPVETKKEKETGRANFLVVGPSFVRARPSAGAPIIETLSPGTSINVAGRTGDYYQIRSLGTNPIRGYIHREDAFFERKR
ncbi:MAG TPA: SH3 domain-containing protein, partial [Candidatus Binatia bacterium]|nr:SH3 domain-containing protein [Candidatus Binatia bacterium]